MKKILTFLAFTILFFTVEAQNFNQHLLQKGIQAYQTKNFDQAISNFSAYLGKDSSAVEGYYYLSIALLHNQEPEDAAKIAKQGLNKFPGNGNLRWTLAEAELQNKNYKQSLLHYDYLNKNSEQLPEHITEDQLKERVGHVNFQLGTLALTNQRASAGISYLNVARKYMPNFEPVYLNLSYAYLQQKNWKAAHTIAEEGLSKFPAHNELLKINANALYQLKEYEDLSNVYYKLYKKNPDDLDIALAYAEILLLNTKQTDAIAVFAALVKKYPKEKKIYESLINIYEASFNFDAKIQILQSMLKHFDKQEVYSRLAKVHEFINKFDEARQYYDTLLTYTDEPLKIKLDIANTFLQEDSVYLAYQNINELAKEYPDKLKVLSHKAVVEEKLSFWKEALATYKKLIQLSDSIHFVARAGFASQQLSHESDALDYYQKAIEKGGDFTAFYGASLLLKDDQQDSSFVLARKALFQLFNELAQQEKELNDQQTLAGIIQKKKTIERIEENDSLADIVFDHISSYDFFKAKQAILAVANQMSASAKLYYLLGKFYHQHQYYKEALRYLDMSTSKNPNAKEVHLLKGDIYFRQDEITKSILAYERVITLDEDNEEAYKHLVKLYQQVNKLSILCKKWLVKYKSNPENESLRENLIAALHKNGQYDMANKIVNN